MDRPGKTWRDDIGMEWPLLDQAHGMKWILSLAASPSSIFPTPRGQSEERMRGTQRSKWANSSICRPDVHTMLSSYETRLHRPYDRIGKNESIMLRIVFGFSTNTDLTIARHWWSWAVWTVRKWYQNGTNRAIIYSTRSVNPQWNENGIVWAPANIRA